DKEFNQTVKTIILSGKNKTNTGKKLFYGVISLIIILMLGILDLSSNPNLSLLIFYLLPLFICTWYLGEWAGVFIATFSMFIWYMDDFFASLKYSHPLIPYWNLILRYLFFIFVSYIIHKLRLALEISRELSRTDYLTGAMNGRFFKEYIDEEIKRAKRYEHIFALAYMDIDNFKLINDRHGHSAGDRFLIDIIQTIRSMLRETDVVARLGGDEFAICFPETNEKQVHVAMERIRKKLSTMIKKMKYPVTFSIGVLICINSNYLADDMLKMVDQLMYSVKKRGKNNIKYKVICGVS
ncbi:MAG: GGDEF domain-containing protein, partial [Spirochaetes bacterium]|nr:GGDEF domain-containing protein [Spirochaetota bacterium]